MSTLRKEVADLRNDLIAAVKTDSLSPSFAEIVNGVCTSSVGVGDGTGSGAWARGFRRRSGGRGGRGGHGGRGGRGIGRGRGGNGGGGNGGGRGSDDDFMIALEPVMSCSSGSKVLTAPLHLRGHPVS